MRDSHVKSDSTHTIIEYTTLAHILDTLILMSVVVPFLAVNDVIASHSSPGDTTPECRRGIQKNTGTNQK